MIKNIIHRNERKVYPKVQNDKMQERGKDIPLNKDAYECKDGVKHRNDHHGPIGGIAQCNQQGQYQPTPCKSGGAPSTAQNDKNESPKCFAQISSGGNNASTSASKTRHTSGIVVDFNLCYLASCQHAG
mmetsp:Transcript_26061/g.39890  ORF Transcript_26061/g.39890 Transcript_26061/m.39890 type:complete len:129 (-) Transcript_26061:284-670(-)